MRDTTVLCGDTTYLKVQGEWHYLAIVMNLAQRQVVGWRAETARFNVSGGGIKSSDADNGKNEEMLFHSGQAVFMGVIIIRCVKQHGLIQSMSRRGNCGIMHRWNAGLEVLSMNGC